MGIEYLYTSHMVKFLAVSISSWYQIDNQTYTNTKIVLHAKHFTQHIECLILNQFSFLLYQSQPRVSVTETFKSNGASWWWKYIYLHAHAHTIHFKVTKQSRNLLQRSSASPFNMERVIKLIMLCSSLSALLPTSIIRVRSNLVGQGETIGWKPQGFQSVHQN